MHLKYQNSFYKSSFEIFSLIYMKFKTNKVYIYFKVNKIFDLDPLLKFFSKLTCSIKLL